MKQDILPKFPYGAVYFRKSNPPKADWERDYNNAREDGMNIFRHWFLWAAIEQAPGKFVWDDYDRQFELAAKNGIKTIIAEMTTLGPEWLLRKFPHARITHADGTRERSYMQVSCASGALNMCWDNDDYRAAAENWITELAKRYKGHPGLGGYDIWNECNFSENVCYCEATQAKFRLWLQKKHGSLERLSNAWHRYGFAEWEDVAPPQNPGPYPDTLDWETFKIETAYGYMHRRAEIIRSIDPDCAITAHGIAGSLHISAHRGADDWRAAAEVEIYGMTWGSSRHGDESWKQFHAADLVRASSRGKPWWHAESYAGPLWLQPNVLGKPRDEGRIASPEDAPYWNMVSLMCGARGILYLRWRPLLDGDLFGAFGAYALDGSRTDRSRAVSETCKWIQSQNPAGIFSAQPVQGQVGIIYAPESQLHCYALRRSTDPYAKSAQGAYQGFFDRNIQADFVHIDDIEINIEGNDASNQSHKKWDLLYLPYPVMLSAKTIGSLKNWVSSGGTLISEGCPAYFGESFHVSPVQPGSGIDELFGVKESYVEFTPDLLGDLNLTVMGNRIWGGEYLQCYTPTTGTAAGWYDDGRIAAVENSYGKGKTLLIGTMPGYGYSTHGGSDGNYRPPVKAETSLFDAVLSFAGKTPLVKISDPRLQARLHRENAATNQDTAHQNQSSGQTYLWIANPKRQTIPARLEITSGNFTAAKLVPTPVFTKSGPSGQHSYSVPALSDQHLDTRLDLCEGCFNTVLPARSVIIYELINGGM